MATICISTTAEEQQKVYDYIKTVPDKQLSVSAISRETDLVQSRARYALDDLVSEGYIEKIPIKQFNNKYIRYKYVIRKEFKKCHQ